MVQKFARLVALVNVSVVLIAALLLAPPGPMSDAGLTRAAYQGVPPTVASISNAPEFPYGSCVPVRVAVRSDVGTPRGTIEFSVDGVVVDTRALPSSGFFIEMVGCCGSRISAPLSVGIHRFALTFIPRGNWGPSHANGQVVIQPAADGSHPVCGVIPTSGLPHGVAAGLATVGRRAGGLSTTTVRMAVSGIAVALAAGVIAAYRRRRAAPPAPTRD